ncbi:GNAT family N-acetyltransferase [Nocardia terpenica]|uniref:GNAT family N-acetyltransferase n=1 Tax=Nocardia terpenica TaxID=455432 RepID=A0A6G9ZF95_9NOCA|nr:GNAT family N-acetyltransferase [Nocardia terpenica]
MYIRRLRAGDPEAIGRAFTEIGWDKPTERYEQYLAEQRAGARACFVAEAGGDFAGYCTLEWRSPYEPFATRGIPEIVDLNVLPVFRRRGIGAALLDAVEATARERSPVVGLGVGLTADYGAAQRLYVRRGYLPDGRGVVYRNRPVPPGTTICLDDDAVLMLTLEQERLRAGSQRVSDRGSCARRR